MTEFHCRLCAAPLTESFCDLGQSPLANSFLETIGDAQSEAFFPLHVRVCTECHLAQLPAMETPQNIFSNYAYFSSFADGWVAHCSDFAESASKRFSLDAQHRVIEIASNDGGMLAAFARHGAQILGIEPAANVAQAAMARGVPTRIAFFGSRLAGEMIEEGIAADLLIANNVLAHVPDLNDFVRGLSALLGPAGVLSIEFPSLLRLIEENQYDTIYHEHFSYFSMLTAENILARHGLAIFDVEDLATHGGSMRIYAQHAATGRLPLSPRLASVRQREAAAKLDKLETYRNFGVRVRKHRKNLLDLLHTARNSGHSIVAYGAPAKGNTLLNYCGIGQDVIEYTVDRNPRKQNRFLPGSHIPVRHPDLIRETRPDYVLILPWNWKDEIIADLAYIREWGGRFIVPVPQPEVIE